MPDPIPNAYADCVHLGCRTCTADPGEFCTNPITDLLRSTPCLTRIRDADPNEERRNP